MSKGRAIRISGANGGDREESVEADEDADMRFSLVVRTEAGGRVFLFSMDEAAGLIIDLQDAIRQLKSISQQHVNAAPLPGPGLYIPATRRGDLQRARVLRHHPDLGWSELGHGDLTEEKVHQLRAYWGGLLPLVPAENEEGN